MSIHAKAEKRTRIQQSMDVLEAIYRGEHAPTHILYKANLGWKVLDGILTLLEEHGLIVVVWTPGYNEQHRKDISLTIRGYELLQQYRKLVAELVPEEASVVWMGETR